MMPVDSLCFGMKVKILGTLEVQVGPCSFVDLRLSPVADSCLPCGFLAVECLTGLAVKQPLGIGLPVGPRLFPDPWAEPKSRSTLVSVIFIIGVLESRFGGSAFGILWEVWVESVQRRVSVADWSLGMFRTSS